MFSYSIDDNFQNTLFCQIPLISSEELALPHPVRCELSWLRCHESQPSFVLFSMQDKTEGEFFLQRLRSLTAGSNPPLSGLSRIWVSPARHLCRYFFHLWFLVQVLWRGPTVESLRNSFAPPSLGKGRIAPPLKGSAFSK